MLLAVFPAVVPAVHPVVVPVAVQVVLPAVLPAVVFTAVWNLTQYLIFLSDISTSISMLTFIFGMLFWKL